MGQVAADEDHVRGPGRFFEPREEVDDPVQGRLPGQAQAEDRIKGTTSHGRDVADVDVQALAAQQAGVLERQAEIEILDQEVLGDKEPSRPRPDDGGVITNAEEDVLPGNGEVPADDRQKFPFAELSQTHVPPSVRVRLQRLAFPGLAVRAGFLFFRAFVFVSRAFFRTSLTSST